jgi:hypothetical protein
MTQAVKRAQAPRLTSAVELLPQAGLDGLADALCFLATAAMLPGRGR